MKPGVYTDISNNDYHTSAGYSSTTIKKFLNQTPASILFEKTNKPKDDKPAYSLGSAVHSLILEPEKFDDDFAVTGNWNLRTNLGKETRDRFVAENQGKIIITPEDYAQARMMANSVLDHPMSSACLTGTKNENSIFWKEDFESREVEGLNLEILLKVRPDAISTDYPIIYDIKTCKSAAYKDFQKDIVNFGYHISAAMYLKGVNSCEEFTNQKFYDSFCFICVEKEPPYQVAVYELDPEFLRIGAMFFNKALERLALALHYDWPTYPESIRIMEPPKWANLLPLI